MCNHKKKTMRSVLLFFFLLSVQYSLANDGAFFVSGNQLIPIEETDISIKKEILTINRINEEEVEVLVYYEFKNPQKQSKKLTVGFEAMSPSGDADVLPVDGHHPYISEFTVEVNNTLLSHKVAAVDDSIYYEAGKINNLDAKQISERSYDGWAEFYYVYYFEAAFKPGLNVVKHSYKFKLSGGVFYNYNFDYILTAAKRWSNKQIDDFTLIINMGEFQDFYIPKSFFQHSNDWVILGTGKTLDEKVVPYIAEDDNPEGDPVAQFYIQKGGIVLKKKNFSPQGELYVISLRRFMASDVFDYEEQRQLPFTTEFYYESAVDDTSRTILRNLPFAKRGYIFKNPELSNYYTTQPWYIPNPSCKGLMSELAKSEQEWVTRWSE